MEEIDLEGVTGGTLRHALYEGYKTLVSYPTAAIAGWKLAGQMYGTHATMNDRVRVEYDLDPSIPPTSFRLGCS